MTPPTPPPNMPTCGTRPRWQEDISDLRRMLQQGPQAAKTTAIKFVQLGIGDSFITWGNRWIVSDITRVGLRVCINTSTGLSKAFRAETTVEKII